MSRMFHRAFAVSALGAVVLAAPATALAATAGGPGGGAGAQTPTRVVVHLPEHVRAGQPIPVVARVIALDAARGPGAGPQPGKGGSEGKGHGKGTAHPGTGKGRGSTKSGGGHHRKGTGHGKPGSGHGKGHRTVTGEVVFFLDGRAEPPAELDHGLAGEKIDIPVGRHTLVAEYTGDGQYESARSMPVTFELTPGQDTPTGGGSGEQPLGGDGVDEGQGQDGPDGPDQGQGAYGQDGSDDGQGQDAGDQDGPGMGFPDQGVHGQDGQDAAPEGALAV